DVFKRELGMLFFSWLGLFRLRRRLVGAVPLKGNIYQSDYIVSPFVMGVFAPKIYLPSARSGKEQEYILLHEQSHVRRGDHIFRLFAFAALVLHWFNPFVWLAFYLSGKDMEMACDEAVMRRMKEDIRAEYSASLLELATGRHLIPGMYLAFGEGDVSSRIKNVMRYKKPTVFWVVFAVLFVSGTVCVFGSDPKTEEKTRVQQENGGMGVEDNTGARNGGMDAQDTDGRLGAKNKEMEDGEVGAQKKAMGEDNGESGLKENGQSSFLTVYSLKNSELVQKLIEGFSSRYPEIEIRCEIGQEGVSFSEQIEALTARLAAGMGPDLLILDGLPADLYQSKGLLTDFSKAIEPFAKELQQNILSAYTQEDKVFMLPVHYMVPAIFADEEGRSAAKSLSSLIEYNAGAESSWKIYLEKYSRLDLLELTYYNYISEFILPDKSVDETELANFLLFTKWIGDWVDVPNKEFVGQYFAASADIEDFAETRAKVMFVPLCGMDDLNVCTDQMEKMAARGIELQWMDGMFFPEGLIGVNAWSQKKELAYQFVQTVFSSQMQLEYADAPGFSVNAKAFAQELKQGNWEKDNPDGAALRNEKLAEQMEKMIAKVSKNQMMDAAVLQILQEESADYFGGEISLADCVEAIIERLP
ncbi:MAG: hypothetical protein K2N63_13120, partial [Lachnospiraceae bacterium]|nr:hypothetical protein [Lachnospiraceae bacterium]